MKKLFALILALSLILSLAACGGTAAQPTEAPTEAPTEPAAPAAPLMYSYSEDRGDFAIQWSITLYGNGYYVMSEMHGLSGNETMHTGTTWTDNGDGTITTGPWDDSSVDKSEFFKPNGECTWTVNGDGTVTPVSEGSSEDEGGVKPGKYTYSENRGDFTIEWTIQLNGNGSFVLTEVHGLSGNVTEHTGAAWTDNGNGTVTTGEWDNHDVDKSEFFKPTGECTWIINEDGTCEPGEAPAAAAAVNPGKYTYVDGETTWEVKIMGNGTCVISEINTASGEVIKEHTTRGSAEGKGWVDNGDGTFETDEWEPEEREDNKVSLASPNGVTTWKIVDAENSLVEPSEKKEEESSIEYGRYLYHDVERDEYWAIMIMGNGNCTIQAVDAQGELLKDENDQIMDYPAKGFRVNDDGTFTNFSMEDESKIPEFLSSGENGMATWKIVDAENKIVEMVVE